MWRSPSQDLEPSIYHTLKTMLEIDADPRFSLDAFVDVHSHSNSRAGFLFMNPLPSSHGSCAPLSEYLYRLPKAMALSVPGFQLSKCCCSTEAFKAACGRRAAGLHLPNTLCYTFEISFFNVADDPTGNNQRTAKARSSSSLNVCARALALLYYTAWKISYFLWIQGLRGCGYGPEVFGTAAVYPMLFPRKALLFEE